MKGSRQPLARRLRKLAAELTEIADEVDELDRLVRATRAKDQRNQAKGGISLAEAEALRDAIKAAGGYRSLARMLDVSFQAIQQWKRCPADRVVDVETATGVSRQRLRPGLYR